MAVAPLIPANWQLPEAFRSRLGSSVGRQRLMQHEQQMLLVMHDVPEPDSLQRKGVLFWRDEAGEWRASNGDPGKVALSNLIERYEKVIEILDLQEAKAERSNQYLELLDGLAPVARSIRNLSEVLQEARKARPDLRELIDLRDRAYDLSRTSELLYQDSKTAMDVAVVRRAEEQAEAGQQMARSAHRLNTLAAVFFPLATLGSIFGTTLTDDWSWKNSIVPFSIFLVAGSLLGILLSSFVNKKPAL